MKKNKLAFGAMLTALIGFSAGSVYAQDTMMKQKMPYPPYPTACPLTNFQNGHCPPPPPPPQCKQPECPTGKCSPDIKPGECWSQCIYPAQFRTVYKPVDVCFQCPTPVVKQDGFKTITIEAYTQLPWEWYPTKCVIKPSNKVQYKKVKPAEYGYVKIKDCIESNKPPQPICKTDWRTIQIPYWKPVGISGTTINTSILIKHHLTWEDLYRKKIPCSPDDIAKGMKDCSSVCNEIKGKTWQTEVPGQKCVDNKCRFKNEKISIAVKYPVKVCMSLPPSNNCNSKTVKVMINPPVYQAFPIMEKVCVAGPPVTMPGQKGPIPVNVPNYKKMCLAPPPAGKRCVENKVQACKPVLVWRQEAMCQNDGMDHTGIISKVQTALVQAGFNAGPINGMLTDQTRQAIRDFQKAKGLAEGGTLTKETVEALGIYE